MLIGEPLRECPTSSTIAAFVEAKLDEETSTAVLAHLETCSECMSAVLAANAHLQDTAATAERTSPRWWMAVAAAVLIALVAVPLLLRRDRSGVARLVDLAPRSMRVAEPRLTGGFAWAPYHGSARSTGGSIDSEMLKLAGEAGELVQRADAKKTADAQHAAGIAMVMIDRSPTAIGRLEIAAQEKNDAAAWSDLAAARYAAAQTEGRTSLIPEALAAADAALRLDPALKEALFNRALILEHMGLANEARDAWLRYLAADPDSPWATEARAHLRDLPAATRSSEFRRDRTLLENAAATGDRQRLRELVTRYPQQARTWAEGEYLAQWADAVRRDDTAASVRALTMARAIGGALDRISGETLLRDAVAAIDYGSPAARAAIAEGHILYKQGRIAYSRQAAAQAEPDLRLAAAHFQEGGSPMALEARYYAASARLAENDVVGARLELERINTDNGTRFSALGAAVRWELARAYVQADDWSRALPILNEGAALYRRLGEHASEAFLEAMAAGTLATLGRDDESWAARGRTFHALSAEGDADLLARSVLSAVDAEVRSGHPEAALSLSVVARAIAGINARPVLAVNTLVAKATIEVAIGRGDDARVTVAEAERAAQQLSDPAIRDRTLADIAVARGAALTSSDPRQAAEVLSGAIDFYRARGQQHALPEPLLLRARCALRRGDVNAAKRDLDEGIAAVEQRRRDDVAAVPAPLLAADRGLFAEDIHLALGEKDSAAAFAYAERSRGGAIALAAMQERLRGSEMAVLEIVALPREVVTFAITERAIAVGRAPLSMSEVEGLARASTSTDARTALAALYDATVRRVDGAIAQVQRIVIVADPALEGVPFAALYDRDAKRYLVERVAVAVASSAASLTRDERPRGAVSVVVAALPSGVTTNGLPESAREVQDVASLYAHATRIEGGYATWPAFTSAASSRSADVVHIAGHTERGQGAGDTALLFAGGGGDGMQRVTWKSVLDAPRMGTGVVVLAACETMRRPASPNTRALTLAEAFAAAGAREVVGTLVPIADRDARELFLVVHRSLVSGDDAVDALRHAQLDAIATPDSRQFPAWGGVAVLTTRIPVFAAQRRNHGHT